MSRRITLTIQKLGPTGEGATTTVVVDSNTVGPGSVADQIALAVAQATGMWSHLEPNSTKPKPVRDARS